MDIGTTPRRASARTAKAVTATLMASLVLIGFQHAASAETGTQRFHVIYAGPLEPNIPPTATVIAHGVINGKGYEQPLSQRPGPEPNTIEATNAFVFPEGTLFFTFTASVESRFNARTCRGFNRFTGTWTITGGTGAYADATGEGTFRGHSIPSGQRTADGCSPQPDWVVSNLHGVGTVTVPDAQAA